MRSIPRSQFFFVFFAANFQMSQFIRMHRIVVFGAAAYYMGKHVPVVHYWFRWEKVKMFGANIFFFGTWSHRALLSCTKCEKCVRRVWRVAISIIISTFREELCGASQWASSRNLVLRPDWLDWFEWHGNVLSPYHSTYHLLLLHHTIWMESSKTRKSNYLFIQHGFMGFVRRWWWHACEPLH